MKLQLIGAATFLFLITSMENLKAQDNNLAYQMRVGSFQTRWARQVKTTNVLSEYPRPDLSRNKWTNLNGLWEYCITDISVKNVEKYDGKILVPFPIESALSGVNKKLEPNQLIWYKRNVINPNSKNSEKTLLHFGAVDFEATVFINGKEIGTHKGGYQNFSFDITDNLKAGSNELVVKVWDPTDQGPNPHGKQVLNPGGIMYTSSSGIWQTVWMEVVPNNYIEHLIITPDVDASAVKVIVKSASNSEVELKAAGKNVIGKSNTVITIPLNNVKLWSPDNPYLYDLTVRLGKDKVNSYFGMRKVEIKKDEKGFDRIFLNNKYYYNLGVLDQGFWPDGLYTAPTDEALEFDILAAKAMGFNTIRKHIKVEPARWYYHADKLGILVWQDMVNPGNDTKEGREQFERECAVNIAQLYNYPCITTWVLFNEKWGQYDQARLTKWVKETDTTRLVNGHSGEMLYVNDRLRNPSPEAWIYADMTDVHAYPMPGHIKLEKGKAAVLGEFGGIGVPIEGHLWDELVTGWGYDGVVTPNKMKHQYAQMIDSLKVMEGHGLTASIYTQPFDVESEQNGLMTYDREIIKLPIQTIRGINSKLWPANRNIAIANERFNASIADTLIVDYATRLKAFERGMRDSIFLRRLTVMARTHKDFKIMIKVAEAYFNQMKNPFTENNLKFINTFTVNTSSKGFDILWRNSEKIDSLLGTNDVENFLKNLIFSSEISKYVPTPESMPDWGAIEDSVVLKYGNLGEAIFLRAQLIHLLNQKRWTEVAITAEKLFVKFPCEATGERLNDCAWTYFENVTDIALLKLALNWSEMSLRSEMKPEYVDTYANLLYKLGRNEDALQWQKKAVLASNGDGAINENYEKMKLGVPTWRVPEDEGKKP